MAHEDIDNGWENRRIHFNNRISRISFGFSVHLHKGNVQINTAADGRDIGKDTFTVFMVNLSAAALLSSAV